jgi:hypothetical protein
MNIEQYKKDKKQSFYPYFWAGILLLAFMVFTILLYMWVLFGKGKIEIARNTFLVYSGIVAVIGIFFGGVWVSSQKSWDLKTFIDRIQNAHTCKHIIFLAQERLEMFKQSDADKGIYERKEIDK